MKTLYIISLLAISQIILAQRYYDRVIYVTINDSIAVDSYFDTVLVETNQPLTAFDINDYPYAEQLPDSGWVEIGDVYSYSGDNLVVRQTHNRSEVSHFNPHDVPALYLFKDILADCPEWIGPQGAYNIGECVTVNGVQYKSTINANTTNPEVFNDEDSPWTYWDKEPFDNY